MIKNNGYTRKGDHWFRIDELEWVIVDDPFGPEIYRRFDAEVFTLDEAVAIPIKADKKIKYEYRTKEVSHQFIRQTMQCCY